MYLYFLGKFFILMKIKYIENCFSSLYLKIEKVVCICILFIVGEVEIGVKNCFLVGV